MHVIEEDDEIDTSFNDVQRSNALVPINNNSQGIDISTNDEHPLKTSHPIETLGDVIVICSKITKSSKFNQSNRRRNCYLF